MKLRQECRLRLQRILGCLDVRCDFFVVLRVWGTDIQIFGQQSIAKRAIRSIVVINKLGARRALASRQVTISAFSVSQAVHTSLGRSACKCSVEGMRREIEVVCELQQTGQGKWGQQM